MYFPYMRAKQFELVALREIVSAHKINDRVIPIIEPVKSKITSLLRTLQEYDNNSCRYILITNPSLGDFEDSQGISVPSEISEVIKKLGGGSSCIIGFLLTHRTTSGQISKYLKSNKGKDIAFIHAYNYADPGQLNKEMISHGGVLYNCFELKHTSNSYRGTFKKQLSVILEDPFDKKAKNELYPEDEYFSDMVNSYKALRYSGFGDYLIVGEEWSVSGGPAHTVAIHLTYKNKDGNLWVRHFLSDSNKNKPVDPAGKFGEALNKLIPFIKANKLIGPQFTGCMEFDQLKKSGGYPGLGVVKKISMKHHIELIDSLI